MYPLLLHLPYFNPRSHEGSDGHEVQQQTQVRDFNPRSHEGSDRVVPVIPLAGVKISIHAPTRGATQTGLTQKLIVQFQSTLPRGERQVHSA